MVDADLKFKENLKTTELRKVDFKEQQYPLDNKRQKSKLVKDILCMANAPDADGYILIGVKSEKGKPRGVVSISHHYDSSTLEDIVNSIVEEPIHFEYFSLTYQGKPCALLYVPLSKARPHRPKKDFGVLKKHIFYTRRASGNREASIAEIREMFLSSIRVSDIAYRKVKSSKHIIDELADMDKDDRKLAMYRMLKSIARKIHLTNYNLVFASYNSTPICALVARRREKLTHHYAIFMYPWTAKGDNIIWSRRHIDNLISGSRSTKLKPQVKTRLERSMLVHVCYKEIYTRALETKPFGALGGWFANEWREAWGKVIKWSRRREQARYEFFLPNVASEAELKDRIEKLLAWVYKNIT